MQFRNGGLLDSGGVWAISRVTTHHLNLATDWNDARENPIRVEQQRLFLPSCGKGSKLRFLRYTPMRLYRCTQLQDSKYGGHTFRTKHGLALYLTGAWLMAPDISGLGTTFQCSILVETGAAPDAFVCLVGEIPNELSILALEGLVKLPYRVFRRHAAIRCKKRVRWVEAKLTSRP